MDEPCSGMSPRSVFILDDHLDEIAERHPKRVCLLVATHNPFLMQRYGRVFDMDRLTWTTDEEFLASQGEPWDRPDLTKRRA
jgi:predicted ATPase